MSRRLSPFLQLCLINGLARLSYQMARSPVLPRFAQELGAKPELIGLIAGASTMTGVFFKFPSGVLSDIVGRRRMMRLAMCFFAIPPFFYPIVSHPFQLLILRFIHGFATAIFSPVASAAVADLFQEARGEKLGWFAASGELGSTIGPVIGGFMLVACGFAPTYLLVGILGVVPLVLMWMVPVASAKPLSSQTGKERLKAFGEGVRAVATQRSILIASAMEGCLFLGAEALMSFLPLYAKPYGINEAQVGLILGAQLVTAMAAKPLTGKLSDRMGRKPMIVAGLGLCAVVLPLVALSRSFWILFVLSGLFGLGMAIVTPSTTALVADLCRDGRHGAALGIFGTIWDIGHASGPILAGVLVGSVGYLACFGTIAAVMTIGLLTFALAVRDPLRRQA